MLLGFWQVEQNPARLRTCFQNLGEQRTLATTDIDNAPKPRKIIGSDDRRRDGTMHADHGIVKTGAMNRLVGEKIEQIFAECRSDAGLPSSQHVKKLIPRLPLPRARYGQDGGARGP